MPDPKNPESSTPAGALTEVAGLEVGHFTDSRRPTGCTVILARQGAVPGVEVRGSGPGTRETDLLDPVNTVQRVQAVLLSGGSAFGLDAASGVMQYLEEHGLGYVTSVARVPIVPAAILFDLALGDPSIRPDKEAGYQACLQACVGPVEEGNVGAGAGATVGKLLGMERAMKSGLGTASLRSGDLVVGALAAVNAVGDVVDPKRGRILAGARGPDGKSLVNLSRVLRQPDFRPQARPGQSTTLVVVGTNAVFDKPGMTKIARMSQDGLARSIVPAHMPFDGDTVFALSTGSLEGMDLGSVGALAAQVTARAIVRATLQAERWGPYPAHSDLARWA